MTHKCHQCGECCKNTTITLNTFDLAKLLWTEKEWTLQEYNPQNKNWGLIKHEKQAIITIQGRLSLGKYYPVTELTTPCPYHENKKCKLHKKKINKNTTLGANLTRLKIPLNTKPTICRNHPYYY